MARTRDWRLVTGITSAPVADGTPNKIQVFANQSGILLSQNQLGTVTTIGQMWTGSLSMLPVASASPGGGAGGPGAGQGIATGNMFFNTNLLNNVTGIVYGGTGTRSVPTFLGVPTTFLSVIGPSGEQFAVPAYTWT